MKNKTSRRKQPSLRSLINKADLLHSRIIRYRDGYRCVICRSDHNIECGHIFSRRHTSTRWDVTPDGNCHAQCHACNQTHTTNPTPFITWYTQKFGQQALNTLAKRAKSIIRLSIPFVSDVIKSLKAELGRLQSHNNAR